MEKITEEEIEIEIRKLILSQNFHTDTENEKIPMLRFEKIRQQQRKIFEQLLEWD